MDIGTKHIKWNGTKQQEAIDILLGKGHMIVSPTKVGYNVVMVALPDQSAQGSCATLSERAYRRPS